MYHETIFIDNISGSEGLPITFASFLNEKVVLDGTKAIDSLWVLHSDKFGRPRLILTFGNCLWIDQK